jgi:hypothetical protein
MVWNKTTDEKCQEILNECLLTDDTNEVIAKKFTCSSWLIGDLCRKHLTKEERKARWTRLSRRSKIGELNPMSGKTGLLHHNAVTTTVRSAGYKTVFPPTWWKGSSSKGRVGEHIINWAYANGYDHLPDKCVVHHIDEDIDNNDPSNLLMMSISEHIKLHWRLRKAQRLSSNGVESSTLEAQGNK